MVLLTCVHAEHVCSTRVFDRVKRSVPSPTVINQHLCNVRVAPQIAVIPTEAGHGGC